MAHSNKKKWNNHVRYVRTEPKPGGFQADTGLPIWANASNILNIRSTPSNAPVFVIHLDLCLPS